MKSRIAMAIAALMFGGFNASAQITAEPAPADTVIIVKSPKSVIVSRSADTTTVSISGSETDSLFNYQYTATADTAALDVEPAINLPFSGRDRSGGNLTTRSFEGFRGIYVGASLPLSAPDFISSGWEIGINNVLGYSVRRHGAELMIGVGASDIFTNIDNGFIATKIGDKLAIVPAPENARDVKSSIATWRITVPLSYTQRICNWLDVQLAVVANLNVKTEAKMSYKIDDTKYSDKIKGLHQRLLTPEFFLTVGAAEYCGVYVRWSPVKTFKNSFGPEFSTLGVGLMLSF